MISRRSFTVAGAALAAFVTQPVLAALGGASGVSPDLARLADLWQEDGYVYEAVREDTGNLGPFAMKVEAYYHGPDSPKLVCIREARARMLDAIGRVMEEPSHSAGDVILKYHVIDTLYIARPLHDERAFKEAGGYGWYETIEREAHLFEVDINRLWRPSALMWARIDGERHSPRWSAISRWRPENYGGLA